VNISDAEKGSPAQRIKIKQYADRIVSAPTLPKALTFFTLVSPIADQTN
jgi:hypothetical protein